MSHAVKEQKVLPGPSPLGLSTLQGEKKLMVWQAMTKSENEHIVQKNRESKVRCEFTSKVWVGNVKSMKEFERNMVMFLSA